MQYYSNKKRFKRPSVVDSAASNGREGYCNQCAMTVLLPVFQGLKTVVTPSSRFYLDI